jgi:hypothetical protein
MLQRHRDEHVHVISRQDAVNDLDTVRHFQPGSGHRARLQASSGGGATDIGCGSRSKGLEAAQTLLVAIRKYLAVVAKLP